MCTRWRCRTIQSADSAKNPAANGFKNDKTGMSVNAPYIDAIHFKAKKCRKMGQAQALSDFAFSTLRFILSREV